MGVPLADAATITVNPCSAYRMLRDYVQLDKQSKCECECEWCEWCASADISNNVLPLTYLPTYLRARVTYRGRRDLECGQ